MQRLWKEAREPKTGDGMKRLLSITAMIRTTSILLLMACVTAGAAENPWITPNRSTFPFSDEEYAELDTMMEPCSDYARATFSEAALRLKAGLPKKATLNVMLRTTGPDDHPPNFYIRVEKANDNEIRGRIVSNGVILDGRRYKWGKKYKLAVSDIIDWLIISPDRPEEGNLLGRYLLLRQDGLISGPCDPQHNEYQHFRLFRESYSFVPPIGASWRLYGRDEKTQTDAVAQEHGAGPDEANTVFATRYEVPLFESDLEFVRFVEQTEKKNVGDPDRYNLKEHEVSAHAQGGARCALSHQLIEDNAALKRTGERTPMLREIRALVCIHPGNSTVAVTLTYSHRYQPGYRDTEFITKTDAVFRSLAFSKLK